MRARHCAAYSVWVCKMGVTKGRNKRATENYHDWEKYDT